jgi:hypothetical protein
MHFVVGARGVTSGKTAQTTFTDANTFNVTPLSQTVAPGSINTFVWTFTAQNSANVATTTFTIPAGWTPPQSGAGPGQVTVTAGTCAASFNSISGSVITINQGSGGCNNTESLYARVRQRNGSESGRSDDIHLRRTARERESAGYCKRRHDRSLGNDQSGIRTK